MVDPRWDQPSTIVQKIYNGNLIKNTFDAIVIAYKIIVECLIRVFESKLMSKLIYPFVNQFSVNG